MREETVTIKIYEFKELSGEAKETAVQGFADINVDHEWWDGVFDDAATLGLKITEFSIDRGAYCRGTWTTDAEAVAALVLKNHGESCETHKDATAFLASLEKAEKAWTSQPGYDAEYDEDFEDTDEYEELCQEFKKMICEDYRIILGKEYEYLTGEAAIIESIEANEYEFTADGERYS